VWKKAVIYQYFGSINSTCTQLSVKAAVASWNGRKNNK